MSSAGSKAKNVFRMASLAVSLAVLAALGWLIIGDIRGPGPAARPTDAPPVVEFTWTPLGQLTLEEFKGFLSLKDDRALDFTTYKFRIVELDRTVTLPIEGMIGKEYTSDIYLSWLADNAKVMESEQLTFEISVSDDSGQNTSIRKTVKLRKGASQVQLKAGPEGWQSPE